MFSLWFYIKYICNVRWLHIINAVLIAVAVLWTYIISTALRWIAHIITTAPIIQGADFYWLMLPFRSTSANKYHSIECYGKRDAGHVVGARSAIHLCACVLGHLLADRRRQFNTLHSPCHDWRHNWRHAALHRQPTSGHVVQRPGTRNFISAANLTSSMNFSRLN